MAPKQKPNGYSLFVSHRCRETKTGYAEGFGKFAVEWKDLDEKKKEYFKNLAKASKATLTGTPGTTTTNAFPQRIAPEIPLKACSHLFNPRPTLPDIVSIKAPTSSVPEEDWDEGQVSDDDWDTGVFDSKHSFSSPPPDLPPCKRTFVGDDLGGDIVYFGGDSDLKDDEKHETEPLFELTSDADLMKNVWDAYRNINEIRHQHVFVVSCIPVIYAAGFKKASNPTLNRLLEIAVAVFSISNGVEQVHHHYFTHPGSLLPTQTCHAIESRMERHGIPHSDTGVEDDSYLHLKSCNFDLSRDYYGVYYEMLKLMGYDGTNHGDLPPLLTTAKNGITDERCFRWLAHKAQSMAQSKNRPGLPQLNFGTIENFCQLALYLRMHKEPISFVYRDLVDLFSPHNCNNTLSCRFHKKLGNGKMCALAVARELSFKALHVLKETYELPEGDPFVFLRSSFPDSDDEDE